MKKRLSLSKERICGYNRMAEQRLAYTGVHTVAIVVGTIFCALALVIAIGTPVAIVVSGDLHCAETWLCNNDGKGNT